MLVTGFRTILPVAAQESPLPPAPQLLQQQQPPSVPLPRAADDSAESPGPSERHSGTAFTTGSVDNNREATSAKEQPATPTEGAVAQHASVVQGVSNSGGGSGGGGGGRLVMVVNCHLTSGPVPERRMRQVFEGLDTARKEAARLLLAESAAPVAGSEARGTKRGNKAGGGGRGKGGKGGGAAPLPGASVPVVLCGDFNDHGRTAVWELVTQGAVGASYRERDYPEVGLCALRALHPNTVVLISM